MPAAKEEYIPAFKVREVPWSKVGDIKSAQTGETLSFLNWAWGCALELSASPMQTRWTDGMLAVSILQFGHYEFIWPARGELRHPGGSLAGEWAAREFSVQSMRAEHEVRTFENAVTFLLDLYSGEWHMPNWSDWVADAWTQWCATHRLKSFARSISGRIGTKAGKAPPDLPVAFACRHGFAWQCRVGRYAGLSVCACVS